MLIFLFSVLTILYCYLFVEELSRGKKAQAALSLAIIVMNVTIIVTSILKA